jgi:hypothetical protein
MGKVMRFIGWAAIIVVLLVGWRYFLESTRPEVLTKWEGCKKAQLAIWARTHPNQVSALLDFTADHVYSFGAESRSDSFDDHDSRGTAVRDAEKLGISEVELIHVDQRILQECGPFPRG